ncbi:MAG: hypothetical protein BECKG1743D_GA0114223_112391, partial [Candidatus Kentron sp. G]
MLESRFAPNDGKKRFVIALKYEGETDYRYLVASDLTWRTDDIVQAFTLSVTARVISGVASHIQVEQTEALHVS